MILTKFRYGIIAPDNSVGADGDYYINTVTKDVYQRISGIYSITSLTNLIDDTDYLLTINQRLLFNF